MGGFYPSGFLAYSVVIPHSDARIVSATMLGYTSYALRLAVANIDGAGRDGVYTYLLVVKDRTSAALATPITGSFQLYQGEDFNVRLNEIGAAIDTLENQDNWVARSDNQVSLSIDHTTLLNRTDRIEDTVNGVIDSLQSGFQLSPQTQADLVDATWDELHVAHSTPGSFGQYLNAEISGVGSGGGAYAVALIAYDSVRGQTVPAVSMAVRNLSQTALIGSGRTDPEGTALFNLDAAYYCVVATAPGYLFQPFDTVAVSGAQTDTIMGYPFDPGAPASRSLCRVWGYLYDISGVPMSDQTITVSLPSGVKRQGMIVISPFQVATVSDSTGYFYLDLIPSDSLTPTGSKYEITVVTTSGTALRQRVTVPALASWQISW